jgi:hypothetical protein
MFLFHNFFPSRSLIPLPPQTTPSTPPSPPEIVPFMFDGLTERHGAAWFPGRRGSLCPRSPDILAAIVSPLYTCHSGVERPISGHSHWSTAECADVSSGEVRLLCLCV